MKITITLDKSKLRKKGHPIVLSIYVSKSDRCYPTLDLYSFSDDWDFNSQQPKKSHPLYFVIMDKLFELRRKINKLENSGSKKNSSQIYNYLLGDYDCIYTFWQMRINEEKKKLEAKKKAINSGGNAEFYENTLHVWKKYKSTILYEEINYDFLTKFKIDKSSTCKSGGINTYLKAIRAIYNDAVKRGYYVPETLISPFSGIMEPQEPTKDKYFNRKEMSILYHNPIDHKFYKYFMLCFYLGGLDFIDIASIKKSNIRDNRLKFRRFKGNTKEIVDNYIFKEAQEIIDYFSEEGSEYITPLHKYVYIKYRKRYVVDLKAMFLKMGITSHVDSKTPRYSFIHIGSKELYQNRDIIKELVGHAQNDVHSIYEGKFPVKIKDEIHRKIIDSIIESDED